MNREPGHDDRTEGRLHAKRDSFEPLSRRAHPVAEHGGMGRGVVVGVVRRVRHRQRVHEPAEEQETGGQADCEGTLQGSTHRPSGIQRNRKAEY